jgi:trehalose synthase-fused probable maltokinase
LPARRIKGEQSNTSYIIGDMLMVKMLRKLAPGVHPDVEIGEFLTRVGFPHSPRLVGVMSYQPQGRPANAAAVVALVQEFVPSRGDAWEVTLADLREVLAGEKDVTSAIAPIERLGEITGAMHAALASDPTLIDFAPEAIGPTDRDALVQSVRARLDAISTAQKHAGSSWPANVQASVKKLVDKARTAMPAIESAASTFGRGLFRTRVHGDYHLGQVLATAHGFVVIDFEGEPLRPIAERRARSSPLRDVAGMLRSFNYAAHVAKRESPNMNAAVLVHTWEQSAREAFLRGYLARASGAPVSIAPRDPKALGEALALLELDKALYEVHYEIEHRPDWVAIPVEGAERAIKEVQG